MKATKLLKNIKGGFTIRNTVLGGLCHWLPFGLQVLAVAHVAGAQ